MEDPISITSLYERIRNTDLKIENKKALMRELSRVEDKATYLDWYIVVNGIIMLYYEETVGDNDNPFLSTTIDRVKGIKYQIKNIPDELANILGELVRIYTK